MESEDNGALTDCNRISILFSLKLFLSDYWSATNALLCEKSEKQLGTSSRDTQKAFSHKNTCKRLLKNLQHFVYFQSNGFFILIFILIFILLFYSPQRQNNGMTWFMSHDFGFFFFAHDSGTFMIFTQKNRKNNKNNIKTPKCMHYQSK